jgi:hypothetical protein
MIDETEKLLRPVDNPYPIYPAKYIPLKNGKNMVIRQITREEVPALLPIVEPLIHVDRDFYNLVGVRVYAELLGYMMYRVQDEYVFAAQVEGELVGIVNGRFLNKDIGVSYHTLCLKRGARIGAHIFASKMEYHLDYCKQKEVLVVAESPIGFRRWMGEYNLAQRFDMAHELGGCPSWTLTKELYDNVKGKLVEGIRPVPEEMMAKAKAAILPPSNPPAMEMKFE